MKRLVALVALSLSCASCAVMNARNRPLMNYCSEHLVPDNTALHLLAAPVVYPACLLAGVADAVVAHPISVLDDAWNDTEAALWQPTDRGFVTECALIPIRAALTPIKYALQFGARATLDMPHWPPPADELEGRLLAKNRKERFWVLSDLRPDTYRGDDVAPATDAMVKACNTHADDPVFCVAVIQRLPGPLSAAAVAYLGERARTGRGEVCAVSIWRLMMDSIHWRKEDGGDEARDRHMKTATNRMAQLYDDLARAGHHEAELYVALLAGQRLWLEGPQALALYVLRSLEKRHWPDYAARIAFQIQTVLIDRTDVARIDALALEWPVLQLSRTWLKAVEEAFRRRQTPDAPPLNRAALTAVLKRASAELRDAGPEDCAMLRDRSKRLVELKTLISADELVERLLKGPKADLALFLGHPLDLLRKKGEP